MWSLIGSPKGYVGSEQGGELTNKILHSKSKIIVIDELDKADEAIFTFFYEMLEDGQYTDLDGKVIDLDGYIIVFTANLNNTNFKDMIPEPLFSRFDMTYEFQPLSYADKVQFVSDFTDKLHFAPVSGHWCVCQWPLGATSGRKLIDHFVFDHNVIMFCYPLEQRVG